VIDVACWPKHEPALAGEALGVNLPQAAPPTVHLTNVDKSKLSVTVMIDNSVVAAKVEQKITKDNCVINSANSFDGRSSLTPSDTVG
jgi:hypothetical protein